MLTNITHVMWTYWSKCAADSKLYVMVLRNMFWSTGQASTFNLRCKNDILECPQSPTFTWSMTHTAVEHYVVSKANEAFICLWPTHVTQTGQCVTANAYPYVLCIFCYEYFFHFPSQYFRLVWSLIIIFLNQQWVFYFYQFQAGQ